MTLSAPSSSVLAASPSAAEQVAQAAARHEAEGEGSGVGGQHPLQGRVGAAEVGADGRAGQVGHRGVDEVHDVGHEDDDEETRRQVGEIRKSTLRVLDPCEATWRSSFFLGG